MHKNLSSIKIFLKFAKVRGKDGQGTLLFGEY